jgi:hypothetical protein
VPISDTVVSKTDLGSFFGKASFRMESNGDGLETLEAFGFKDAKGVLWKVPRGTIVSGAAIPRIAWSVVGSPLDGELAVSSAFLEYYVDQRTCSREDTLQMFYESMITSSVGDAQAKVIYTAVRTFGPNWTDASHK